MRAVLLCAHKTKKGKTMKLQAFVLMLFFIPQIVIAGSSETQIKPQRYIKGCTPTNINKDEQLKKKAVDVRENAFKKLGSVTAVHKAPPCKKRLKR